MAASNGEGRPGQGGLQDQHQVQDISGDDILSFDDTPFGTPEELAAAEEQLNATEPAEPVIELAAKDEPEEPKPAEPEPAKDEPAKDEPKDPTAKLQPQHLAELWALGVDDDAIARLNIRSYVDTSIGRYAGWSFDWTDGTDTVRALIPDRDKRKGPKVEWPKGQTLIVGCIRYVKGSTRHVVVEGPRQALASYAPDDVSVWVMNGCNGIHGKIRDRLSRLFAGDVVTIVTDADWKSNDQVGRAATEAAPEHLAAASEVLVADVGGKGTDGIDDLILATPENERAELVAKILADAKPARDRRLELETERELIRLRARDRAQRLYVAETRGELPGPDGTVLAELLAEPDDEAIYRVEGLWPMGGNFVFSA
jgi:hypothetical protein